MFLKYGALLTVEIRTLGPIGRTELAGDEPAENPLLGYPGRAFLPALFRAGTNLPAGLIFRKAFKIELEDDVIDHPLHMGRDPSPPLLIAFNSLSGYSKHNRQVLLALSYQISKPGKFLPLHIDTSYLFMHSYNTTMWYIFKK